jgi:hypothetical protein
MEVKSPWEARALHLPSYVAKRRYRASSSHIDQEEQKVPAELRKFSLYASDGTLTVFTVTTYSYQYAYNIIGQYLFCFHFDNSEAVKWSSFLQM